MLSVLEVKRWGCTKANVIGAGLSILEMTCDLVNGFGESYGYGFF